MHDMQAGRELDALVAERVMGWAWHEHPTEDLRYFRPSGRFQYGAIGEKSSDRVEYTSQLPAYSTDIAASEQVVDAMFQRGYWCQERTPWNSEPTPGFDDGYWCGFTPHGTTGWNGTPDHWTCTATRPLARCLAALAAMEAHDAPGT